MLPAFLFCCAVSSVRADEYLSENGFQIAATIKLGAKKNINKNFFSGKPSGSEKLQGGSNYGQSHMNKSAAISRINSTNSISGHKVGSNTVRSGSNNQKNCLILANDANNSDCASSFANNSDGACPFGYRMGVTESSGENSGKIGTYKCVYCPTRHALKQVQLKNGSGVLQVDGEGNPIMVNTYDCIDAAYY